MARTRAIDPEALIARIDELVRAHRALPAADLRAVRRHLPLVAERLRASGLEVGSNVRVRLETQLLERAQAGFLLRKGLERHVAGGSAREVKDAVDRLVARGELVSVVRESGPGVVAPASDVLADDDLAELLRCLEKVGRLARKARATRPASATGGKRTTILREDVAAPLARILADASGARPPAHEPPPPPRATGDQLTREIDERLRQMGRPVRVPGLLRSLALLGASVADGQRALLEGAAGGLFELEPESGMGRLSPEDAMLCPPGPMGTRLSWVSTRSRSGSV